jgi:hypothetical protein
MPVIYWCPGFFLSLRTVPKCSVAHGLPTLEIVSTLVKNPPGVPAYYAAEALSVDSGRQQRLDLIEFFVMLSDGNVQVVSTLQVHPKAIGGSERTR